MELAAIILIAVIVGIYYGMGRNVEVASGMLTRELEEAERMQKERVVKRYKDNKNKISDADFKKAAAEITRINELDI